MDSTKQLDVLFFNEIQPLIGYTIDKIVSDIIECQSSRGCPFVMLIVGASSLHHSLEKWDNIRKRLRGKVISKPGYNLHPNAKDKYKIVQNRLRYVENNTKIILWHDIINNTVTSPKSDNRTPLNGDQLKVEIERLQRKVDIVGIVYCVREGAPDVLN